MKRKLIPAALLLFATAFVQTGCDKIRGCTDTYSDNYDPEATEDDDTCVPTRLKFIGDYDAHGTALVGVDTLESFDQVDVTITDETAEDPYQLIIGISNFDELFYSLDALIISRYNFNIPTKTIGAFTFFGEGNINGRVLEMSYTRIEKYETAVVDSFGFDTLQLNLYGIQELPE